eukprot:gb/GFBE01000542.1/.p1 GENE.gb/GFBE01000542.1/~~gb/GFBE01000542.1/.p1  ORF type:complete len:825 (+),score=151.56 gb/GFBE01000542.1/:1-2475(+)
MTATSNALAAAAVANIRATAAEALARERQTNAPAADLMQARRCGETQEAMPAGYALGELSAAEKAAFQSPYALGYFGAGALGMPDYEDLEVDYGQFELDGEEDAFSEDDDVLRPARVRPATVKDYVVDNSQLQADAPGVAYRLSQAMDDRDEKRPVAMWGSIVSGEDTGDGWLKVGERFLPFEVQGAPVLLLRAPSRFRSETRVENLDEDLKGEEEDEAVAENRDEILPWKDGKALEGKAKRNEAPEERRRRLLEEERKRAADKEHEEFERNSREMLRKHRAQLRQPVQTHYSVLGVRRAATADEISAAYKECCKLYHPDKAAHLDRAGRWVREKKMAQINEAYAVLSSAKQRWAYDRAIGPEPEEKDAETADLHFAVKVAPTQPTREAEVSGVDADFDFSGDGRPFRCSRGKAARVAQACGSKERVRIAMNQLVGKQAMELADCGGVVRHVGAMSPFAGLGECAHPRCRAHRLQNPEVRAGFRDFIVGKVRDAVRTGSQWWGPAGLHYASLGSGELLFDLELVERLREEAGVHIERICLIDKAYRNPGVATRRALREFADWQRASAQLRREEQSAEILAFGRLGDYFEAAVDGGRATGCHIFVHCDAHWQGSEADCERLACRSLVKGGLLARLSEGRGVAAVPVQGALVSPFNGDVWAEREDKEEPIVLATDDLQSEHLSNLSIAHIGGLHEGEPFFSAAWTVTTWPPECFRPPSLQPLQHPLLSSIEELSRVRQLAKEQSLTVWQVVYKPRIAVRAGPSAQAQIVDVFYAGDELVSVPGDTDGPWLRLHKDSWKNPDDAPTEAWILRDGTAVGLGFLVEEVR